ncbi:hypothetical protein OV203_37095 [Nannocystis sp. ILAH1]|uniref:hypothetical protein n=1 Tax=Nannocystis sp. ILAH1 TaxID=2996789 RepID=UPI002270559F|nr:hypothetical protein [Nannocystis sp. ILAH1]MCY0992817.1 hypothetical protein [Nannocystis sp. ILAH1]
METDLLTLAALEHLPSVGLLLVACVVLWRREGRTTDKLVATLEGQTAELKGAVAELKGAVEAGLTGLKGQVADHGRRITLAEQRLSRHSQLLTAVAGSSGVYPRPRAVAEDEL